MPIMHLRGPGVIPKLTLYNNYAINLFNADTAYQYQNHGRDGPGRWVRVILNAVHRFFERHVDDEAHREVWCGGALH